MFSHCAIAERLFKVFTDIISYFKGQQAKTALIIQILVHIVQMLGCSLLPEISVGSDCMEIISDADTHLAALCFRFLKIFQIGVHCSHLKDVSVFEK